MLAGIKPSHIQMSRRAAGPYGPQIPSGPDLVSFPTAIVAATPATNVNEVAQTQTTKLSSFGCRLMEPQRLELNDPAHGTQELQPRRSRRALQRMVAFLLKSGILLQPTDENLKILINKHDLVIPFLVDVDNLWLAAWAARPVVQAEHIVSR